MSAPEAGPLMFARPPPVPGPTWTPVEYVESGVFAGQYMSFWLELAQQPLLGRRKTDKDRRPIAPAPIVRLHIRQSASSSAPAAPDFDYNSVEASNFICAADIQSPIDSESHQPPLSSPAERGFSSQASPALSSSASASASTSASASVPPWPYPPLRASTSDAPRRSSSGLSASASTPNLLAELDPGPARALGGPQLAMPAPTASSRGAWGTASPGRARLRRSSSSPPASNTSSTTVRAVREWDDSLPPSIAASTSASASAPPSVSSTARSLRALMHNDDVPAPRSAPPTAARPPDTLPSMPTWAAQPPAGSALDADRPPASVRGTGGRPGSRGSEKGGRGAGRGRGRPRNDATTAGGRNLYGNLHVSGIKVPAPDGAVGLWFLFTDLCVRQEGSYSLRIRCFDMSAVAGEHRPPVPPLVELRSRDFRVFSPRMFPGLPKPTELATHFAAQGYKLNTRKNERQAPDTATPTAAPSPPKRPSPKPLQGGGGGSAGASGTSGASGASGASGSRSSESGIKGQLSGGSTTTWYSTGTGFSGASGSGSGAGGVVKHEKEGG
ncbi:hypothetical protein Q5752_006530 [Cryptotrichosporon argae]